MLCYRDMTFCKQSDECANRACFRNFETERPNYENACKRAKFDWPIAFADMKDDKCGYVPRNTGDDKDGD